MTHVQEPVYAPGPPTSKRPWWRTPFAFVGMGVVGVLIIEGAIFGSIAAIGTVAKATAGSNTFTVEGSLTLTDSDADGDEPVCEGPDGYTDVTEGAQVIVSDAGGKTLAIGTLGPGRQSDLSTCVFPLTVKDVPSGKKFYGIEVAHRGAVKESEKYLRNSNVDLTLGS